jgi:polysaccharide export outer membrane protein
VAAGKRLTLKEILLIRRRAPLGRRQGVVELMNVRGRLLVTCAAAMLASCAYGPDGGKVGETGQVQLVSGDVLPSPTSSDVAGRTQSYLIGPQDVLIVDVLGMEELTNREIVVDGGGRISIPLAGSIAAAGSSPEELAAVITARLRENYLREPIVSVNVKETTSQFVTVDGQVERPGNYRVLGDMTLMRAVASAEGLAEFAKQDDVVVLRTVNGAKYAGVYNLAAIRRGNYPDPAIYAKDVVIVGDSATMRRMRDFMTILPAITSPLIYLLDNN